MAFSFGFYDAVNHDRQYSMRDFSNVFNALIYDGVMSESNGENLPFKITGSSQNVGGEAPYLAVDIGFAWFNNTWNHVDAPVLIDFRDKYGNPPSNALHQIYTVALKVDSSLATRENTIDVYAGSLKNKTYSFVASDLYQFVESEDVHYHILGYVIVEGNDSQVWQMGTPSAIDIYQPGYGVVDAYGNSTPYASNILEVVDAEEMVTNWQKQWFVWLFGDQTTQGRIGVAGQQWTDPTDGTTIITVGQDGDMVVAQANYNTQIETYRAAAEAAKNALLLYFDNDDAQSPGLKQIATATINALVEAVNVLVHGPNHDDTEGAIKDINDLVDGFTAYVLSDDGVPERGDGSVVGTFMDTIYDWFDTPTTGFRDTFQAEMDNWLATEEDAFETWWDAIKDDLAQVDVGNLVQEIISLRGEVEGDETHAGKVDKSGDVMTGSLTTTALRASANGTNLPLGNNAMENGSFNAAIGRASHAEGATFNGPSMDGSITAVDDSDTPVKYYFTPSVASNISSIPAIELIGKQIKSNNVNRTITSSIVDSVEGEAWIITIDQGSLVLNANATVYLNQTSAGIGSHAEGANTSASGQNSHAEGFATVANAQYAHAEGERSIASGKESHAEGGQTKASGEYSHTEGGGTNATGLGAHAEGFTSSATGAGSHAEGQGATASGRASHAEGLSTVASSDYSHTEGYTTTASGVGSHAEGKNTTADGYNAHAEGESTRATGTGSHAEGYGTRSLKESSHSEGYVRYGHIYADGIGAHAEGYTTRSSSDEDGGVIEANGEGSHAEGYSRNGGDIKANSPGSHAEGYIYNGGSIIAGEVGAHAEGYANVGIIRAVGIGAHAEGYAPGSNDMNVASGNGSHAEGINTRANAESSHAEGRGTSATGNNSHSEGVSSKAMGLGAHAEGANTIANGQGSHAEGASNDVMGALLQPYFGYAASSGLASDFVFSHISADGAAGTTYYIIHFVGKTDDLKFVNTQDTWLHIFIYRIGDFVINCGDLSNKTVTQGQTGLTDYTYDIQYRIPYSLVRSIYAQCPYVASMTTYNADPESYVEVMKGNIAIGEYAHSEGGLNKAFDLNSHAEGYCNVAYGHGSHAEGWKTLAFGANSHAEGEGTLVTSQGGLAIGKYNARPGTLFDVGFGSVVSRLSAFSISQTGEIIGMARGTVINDTTGVYIDLPAGLYLVITDTYTTATGAHATSSPFGMYAALYSVSPGYSAPTAANGQQSLLALAGSNANVVRIASRKEFHGCLQIKTTATTTTTYNIFKLISY